MGYFIFRRGDGACAMAQWPVQVWADSWLLSLNLTNIVELGRTGFGYGYYACKQIWALGSHLLGGGGVRYTVHIHGLALISSCHILHLCVQCFVPE